MSKVIQKHKQSLANKVDKFHWTHLFAVVILGGYFFLSKVNMVHAISKENVIESFLQLYLLGAIFGLFLLYIISHEKFFPVGKEIEEEEEKKEKKLLKKYLHHGKILAVFIIGTIGGPVFLALTIRLLLKNFAFKYLILILANIPSTFLTVGIYRGFIHFFNF